MRVLTACLSLSLTFLLSLLPAPSSAQTVIHNQLIGTPSGPVQGLFEVTGGAVTQIPTGLFSNNFPSVSRDGRFITISDGDPLFPDERSGDLWEYDRATGTTRRVIDNETMQLPNGTISFSAPLFSALSPNNQLIAVATQLATSAPSSVPSLAVHLASNGGLVSPVLLGRLSFIDSFQSEFRGISWSPDGSVFATPAYVEVVTDQGFDTAAAGIVLFGMVSGNFVELGPLTFPIVIENPPGRIIENHALPVFSPDGERIAFFSIFYPDVLLVGPATVELITINADGSNRTSIVQFNPGFYPFGLSWTPDGRQLVFSIATQVQSGGQFQPIPDPNTAELRVVDASGGIPAQIPGVRFGFFPHVVPGSSSAACGDVDDDGDVDADDARRLRFAIANPVGFALTPGGAAKCNVFGANSCDVVDVTALRRAVNIPALGPGIQPLCDAVL